MTDKDKEFVRSAILLAMGALQALGPAGSEHVGKILRQLMEKEHAYVHDITADDIATMGGSKR